MRSYHVVVCYTTDFDSLKRFGGENRDGSWLVLVEERVSPKILAFLQICYQHLFYLSIVALDPLKQILFRECSFCTVN